MNKSNFIYLHGFASGPRSKKATFFREKLTESGITVEIPDLNTPDFESMTLSSQIDLVGEKLKEKDGAVVIGSSMGGLVAALSAIRFPKVTALILLAPGFGIEQRWGDLIDPERRKNWKQNGAIEVFHYATESNQTLNYGFVEDLESYSTRNIQVTVPTLILHGRRDDVVPIAESHNFKANNVDNTTLIELDDTHELIETLSTIWNESKTFLHQRALLL